MPDQMFDMSGYSDVAEFVDELDVTATEFYFNDNRLTSIPLHLPNATHLGLAYNHIESLDDVLLGKRYEKMEYLGLMHNEIRDLGDIATRFPNLQELNIAMNPLTTFPDLSSMLNLTTIHAYDTPLHPIDHNLLPPNITYLNAFFTPSHHLVMEILERNKRRNERPN